MKTKTIVTKNRKRIDHRRTRRSITESTRYSEENTTPRSSQHAARMDHSHMTASLRRSLSASTQPHTKLIPSTSQQIQSTLNSPYPTSGSFRRSLTSTQTHTNKTNSSQSIKNLTQSTRDSITSPIDFSIKESSPISRMRREGLRHLFHYNDPRPWD